MEFTSSKLNIQWIRSKHVICPNSEQYCIIPEGQYMKCAERKKLDKHIMVKSKEQDISFLTEVAETQTLDQKCSILQNATRVHFKKLSCEQKASVLRFLGENIAAGHHDIIKLTLHLLQGVNLNYGKRNSPLHLASIYGELSLADLLIQSGAKVKLTSVISLYPDIGAPRCQTTFHHRPLTPLHCALAVDNVRMMVFLMEKISSRRRSSSLVVSVFRAACDHGALRCVQHLTTAFPSCIHHKLISKSVSTALCSNPEVAQYLAGLPKISPRQYLPHDILTSVYTSEHDISILTATRFVLCQLSTEDRKQYLKYKATTNKGRVNNTGILQLLIRRLGFIDQHYHYHSFEDWLNCVELVVAQDCIASDEGGGEKALETLLSIQQKCLVIPSQMEHKFRQYVNKGAEILLNKCKISKINVDVIRTCLDDRISNARHAEEQIKLINLLVRSNMLIVQTDCPQDSLHVLDYMDKIADLLVYAAVDFKKGNIISEISRLLISAVQVTDKCAKSKKKIERVLMDKILSGDSCGYTDNHRILLQLTAPLATSYMQQLVCQPPGYRLHVDHVLPLAAFLPRQQLVPICREVEQVERLDRRVLHTIRVVRRLIRTPRSLQHECHQVITACLGLHTHHVWRLPLPQVTRQQLRGIQPLMYNADHPLQRIDLGQ